MRPRFAIVIGLLPWVLCAQVTIEQRPRPPAKADTLPTANIRVDTSLVLVPVDRKSVV